MRNELVGILLAIAIAASGGVGYLWGSSVRGVQTPVSTSTITSCIVQGETIGVVLRVLSGSTPVSGAIVYGETVGYCNGARQTRQLQPAATNSSGWAGLLEGGFGVYDIGINYSKITYHVSVPVEPVAATYAVFDTISGNITTYVCSYNSNCRIPSATISQSCIAAKQLHGLPIPTPMPWFTAGVNYAGPWEATAVVYDHGSPVFAGCYTGTGQGYFEYQNPSLSKNASIMITAVKLDNGTGSLFVAVNGSTNSTGLPYGVVTVRASADYLPTS